MKASDALSVNCMGAGMKMGLLQTASSQYIMTLRVIHSFSFRLSDLFKFRYSCVPRASWPDNLVNKHAPGKREKLSPKIKWRINQEDI